MDVRLSDRQLTVLRYLIQGMTNVEMAQLMYLSPHTTRIYRTQLLEALGARSAAHAVHRAYEEGILPGTIVND